MDGQVKAQYLAAYTILRAIYADNVPLLSRIGWVLDQGNRSMNIHEKQSVRI